MKLALVAILSCLTLSAAHAANFPETPNTPIQIGESWSYKKTVQTRFNPSASRIIYKVTEKSSDERYRVHTMTAEVSGRTPPGWRNAGTIPHDACLLDFGGGGTLGLEKTCSVTLVQGMDWDTEEVEKNTRTKRRYEVLGTQEIRVGDVSHQAFKIKAEWLITKEGDKARPTRYQFMYWYVPQLRAMAKVVREFYNAAGVLESTVTEDLDSFRQAPAK